ncbi:SbcC/MukB-like Walker B domain-containing protein [Streptomyces sp. NPDC007818]|uniref:SbcC/MukB-like Walker B domain-containing protein n=1 Tax=Streptomyces sp. NPDC007818 TaxID=3364780 RepID=UPI0036A1E76C
MSLNEHPARHLTPAAADELDLGTPTANGRWQPTRAGIVNSWAWASEQLFFSGGWLALVGPNGSGKSLTASMLITVLLDADTSQTALSVSGKAAGTLTSRHTDFKDREDRTGIWWLEYGLRNKTDGSITYLTTGLWLRATAGHLHRAFFIAPGRVGSELTLENDREPVRLDALAKQLAACHGEVFTNSKTLHSSLAQLTVQDERSYSQAVRTRLFAPLNEVQFDALLAVLRSLRSLRTAEAISLTRMRQVLTDALPALDTENLTQIADAMERIAELEDKLQRTRQETKLLETTDRSYRRYLRTLAQTEAAALTAANTDFDNQARHTKQATDQLDTAQKTSQEAAEQYAQNQDEISRLEGRLAAEETLLRDHAGAELHLREERARDLATEAHAAAERAEVAKTDADEAARKAADSLSSAHAAQQQLTRVATDMQAGVTDLEAQAAFEHLLTATSTLAAARTGTDCALDTQQLLSHPLAWTEDRLSQIQAVDHALTTHRHAQESERAVMDERRTTENQEDTRRDAARQATGHRRAAEQELATRLQHWQDHAPLLGPMPQDLTSTGGSADRTDTGRMTSWLTSAAAAASSRIDLPGHQQTAAADSARAKDAANRADQAHAEHTTAAAAQAEAAATYDAARAQADAEATADEQQRLDAHHTYEQARHHAQSALDAAEQAHSEAEATALETAHDWLGELHQWRDGLTHLDAADIPLPDTTTPASGLDTLQPADLIAAAAHAYSKALPRLQHHAEAAAHQVTTAADNVTTLENALDESRRAAPVPQPPAWRTRTHPDGAPLWALVDFHPSLTDTEADHIEGVLLVAGLLDARVTSDGRLCDGDLTFTPAAPATGRTLADLLVVDPAPAIDAHRVRQVLAAIPVDGPGSDMTAGHLSHGVLTASAPDGYQAAFIGRTNRERARQERVARLEQNLHAARCIRNEAQQQLAQCHQNLTDATTERDSLPTANHVKTARAQAAHRREQAQAQHRHTATLLADAQLVLHQALAGLEAAAATRAQRLETAALTHQHAQQTTARAAHAADAAKAVAADLTATALASQEQRARAVAAQHAADDEHAAFPRDAIEAVQAAQQAENTAEEDLTRARTDVIKVTRRHEAAGQAVSEALRALNRAATLPTGGLLPTEPRQLKTHRAVLSQLTGHLQAWQPAALRVTDLLTRADGDQHFADVRRQRHERATKDADKARRRADKEATSVAEIRALHGAEYQQLVARHDATKQQRRQAEENAERLRIRERDADNAASAARAVLETVTPLREAAEGKRDACLGRLGRLVDERLAILPDDLPADTAGRPANLTAGLTWARRLLTDVAGGDRLTTLARQRDRDLQTLENTARKASTALARFDRQVTLLGIEDTPWRRAVVADPAALRGEDLPTVLQDLTATATQLEDDLRADVKQTLKTSLFTRLQRDIQLRRQAAYELVSKISSTLNGVRTGVADVGVQVEWNVREEPDAQHMMNLIDQPASDDTFEQMYDALRQRMNEKAGEPWPDRVAHTFDYRAWHDWKIYVTHASFEAAGKAKFREVSARANPLEALSTGERRLATMLPLLAAAWSTYSTPNYAGPRLLSIDEIDAAFDDPNLRQILTLLRSWDFDVLATAPFMTPLIKKETQRAMVHQVITTGRHRVTVPWLWQGRGEPQPLTLDFTPTPTQDTP